MRPPGKARRGSKPGVCDRRVTQPGEMQRRPNAEVFRDHCTREISSNWSRVSPNSEASSPLYCSSSSEARSPCFWKSARVGVSPMGASLSASACPRSPAVKILWKTCTRSWVVKPNRSDGGSDRPTESPILTIGSSSNGVLLSMALHWPIPDAAVGSVRRPDERSYAERALTWMRTKDLGVPLF